MTKKITPLFFVFALLLCLGTASFAQETAGTIEITITDPNGALVPNATVVVSSSESSSTPGTTGFKRTVTTNDNGFQRVLQIPPGRYDITVTATGFGEKKVTGVKVDLGQTTPVNIPLNVGSDTTVVDVNAGGTDIIPLDTTDTKIQTNISAETAELLPKGTNFASVLKVSPATRPEPLSGQFQVDGASGSENTFIIDGQEVTNPVNGVLNSNSNLPFQLIQEIQIKSSGFEAEYGGATGGVINVVTKGGGNRWRGEFGSQFELEDLQPVGRNSLRLRGDGVTPEYYPPRRDNFVGLYPTGNLSGPIIKDRLWFFTSYTPQIFTNERTLVYLDEATRVPTGEVESYSARSVFQYALARIDAQPFSRVRVTTSYTWNPIEQRGSIPSFVDELSPVVSNSVVGLAGAAFLNQTGGRQNSQSVTGQIVWTPLNNLVLNTRGGHYFLNEKLGSYGIGNSNVPRLTCSGLSPIPFPAGFGCTTGTNNGVPVFNAITYDATERNTFDADATFIVNFGGRHEFKGGYQFNGIGNQVLNNFTDQIVLRYGQSISDYAGNAALPSTPGALGAGLLRVFGEEGDVSSANHGIFFQDKWQPVKRLTFNLGLRTEQEVVPSFIEGGQEIKLTFGDKLAPRLGVAYDLTGDGKTKISAFYGWFYDRFKYELPRGLFGGNYYFDFFFEILPGDSFASFQDRAQILGAGGLSSSIAGGACPTNTTTPLFGRVRCEKDYRVRANSGGDPREVGGIDPDIEPFRQSEFTLTFERDLGRNFVFSSRYTHKQVDRAVEDAGILNSQQSEVYIIGNPGRGFYREIIESLGFIGDLEPQRQYDALEFRLDRRFADNYYFNLNYTLSRLYGNYSGLASSDEDGRLSPNSNRFFDLPFAGYTVAGGPDNGKLPTDRPHALKFYGAYSLDWNERFGFLSNNTTEFQLFTTVQSGSPLTTVVDIYSVDTIPLYGRGDLGRTETFTQTDFAIRHRFRFGPDNRFTIVAEADVLNIFNEANELNRVNIIDAQNFDLTAQNIGLLTQQEIQTLTPVQQRTLAIRRFQERGAPGLIQLVESRTPYALYNITSSFQAPREFRFGFRFLF